MKRREFINQTACFGAVVATSGIDLALHVVETYMEYQSKGWVV